MNKFERQMEEYYEHMNNLKISLSNGENSKMTKNFTFLTDDINLLSYKPQIQLNVVKVSDIGNKLDIQKLMKLSKRYKHKIGKFRKNSIHIEDDIILDTKSEFGKGISITKNEISNLKNLDEILNKKKNLLNKFFEESGFKIKDYEQILKNNFSNGKNEINYEEEKVYRTEESALNKNTSDLIKQDMIRTLEETKKEWHQDHIQHEKLEKLEKERRILNINFLNEIEAKQKISRQKYVDPYSTRDNVSKVVKKHQKFATNKKNLNEISTKIQILENYNNKQNIEIEKNKEIIENLKRNIAIDENEEENPSIILGAKRKDLISDVFKSNHVNQRAKMDRVYEEFQEYKKLIIEKEKNKLKKKEFEIDEETKKYLKMLEIENGVGSRTEIRKITQNKLLIKKHESDLAFKRGITSNYITGYQIRTHDVGKLHLFNN